MIITATHINYYELCRRTLWLFANGIQMEHTSDTVLEGKLIGENSYAKRADKYTEVEVGGSKIDHYDAKNKVVKEVKKSNKMEHAHEAQVKFYIYLLEKAGVEGVTGLLEYPTLRSTREVVMTTDDRKLIEESMHEIKRIVKGECPPVINKSSCKKCSYYEFCYINEME